MKNKRHEHILKAYANSRFPRMICENLPDTMLMFEEIDIYAINFLKGKRIILSVHDIISKEIKDYISVNINNQQIDQSDRKEMLIFYRLAILTVGILEQYFFSG